MISLNPKPQFGNPAEFTATKIKQTKMSYNSLSRDMGFTSWTSQHYAYTDLSIT